MGIHVHPYYKEHYILALYDNEDYIYIVADNPRDLMYQLNIPYSYKNLKLMLSRLTNCFRRKKDIYGIFKHHNYYFKIYMIDMNEKDEIK